MTAIFSGAINVSLFGQWLPRTDIPGLDLVMQWASIGIGFSLFLAAGISHAFNLIDGHNGLSGFIAVGMSLSLAAISHQMGLVEHRDVLFILSSAIAGFLVFKFPFGKIFLGDGGAYVIGHILVWMAILILCAAPNTTPLAILLIFFFLVADMLFAIVWRVKIGVPIFHPDRLHFHQLAMRGSGAKMATYRKSIGSNTYTAIRIHFNGSRYISSFRPWLSYGSITFIHCIIFNDL